MKTEAYAMPSPPEPDLLPYCEANEEWCEARDREIEAWIALKDRDHSRPCEPRDALELRRQSKRVGYDYLVGKRVYAQMKVRLDRKQSHKNLNEQ